MDKQVWQQMGLRESEYERIVQILGREPNYVEVGLFSVMWSEHCSYKHSRPVLKTFPTEGPQVLQGPGENAGVVDIGDGQAVVFKIESHNHPSAIEPYQGAATGVGGIVRDVFAMGARPIALLNSLRFGPLTDAHQRFLFSGVVAGIAGYGNCLGIPTVAGEVYFNDSYKGNCLVNAMCVGLIDQKALAKGTAAGVGNAVMLVGASTGRDGIHGATFASEELSEASQAKRPSVQVGDPFMEKLLLEACLELIERKLVVGMQDLGAAGLTSSGSEMASRGNSGVELDVALVPRREPGMTPYEVMLSESQERMLVVVEPDRADEVQEVFHKWGLNAVQIGRVTDDGYFRILENGVVVANVPAKALTDEAPVYHAASQRPAWQDERQQLPKELPLPHDLTATLHQLLRSPNIAEKAWVFQQYDHMVRDNTVVPPGSDAAVLRIKGTNKGLAMSVDCNSRYVYLDPYIGGMAAVAEAARNLVCAGAKPLAITNCLNFGSPERPEVFWQFKEAVRGMGDACRALDTPVTGGNVSFYNETNGQAVYPTPTVGMIGLLPDIGRRVTQGFKVSGDAIVLLGETLPEIGGSEYLAVVHGLEQGAPPRLDLSLETALQQLLLWQIATLDIHSAHDCAEGGLAVALAESAISGGLGCRVSLSSHLRPDELLFSESQSRVVVTLPAEQAQALLSAAREAGVPAAELGTVGGEELSIAINGETKIKTTLSKLQRTWQEAIPCLMGS
ncbi:MAG: phosphoribosylformylglycinamidine synthase subunit PurL [Bacillota bacterium]|jgi:phosphoribosylformylglycinamidine synthase II